MERLRALVPFLSKFEAPGFEFGHVCSFFDSDLSPGALDFVSTCYKAGWIAKDFEGTEWEDWVTGRTRTKLVGFATIRARSIQRRPGS